MPWRHLVSNKWWGGGVRGLGGKGGIERVVGWGSEGSEGMRE